MKKIAISQSNYIPWKGYFDGIAQVDEFVLYDDMQYTKRDWRNRNQIKTPMGQQWITVPVQVKGKFQQKIKDTLIANSYWAEEHLRSFKQNYAKAAYFREIYQSLEDIYLNESFTHLSVLNKHLIEFVCNYLDIKTQLRTSSELSLVEGKTERLVDLCLQAEATDYYSGPAAKNYIDERLFAEANIRLHWFNYSCYPEYPQLWGDFVHGVSILDLLFNCGKNSTNYMKFRESVNEDVHD